MMLKIQKIQSKWLKRFQSHLKVQNWQSKVLTLQ